MILLTQTSMLALGTIYIIVGIVSLTHIGIDIDITLRQQICMQAVHNV